MRVLQFGHLLSGHVHGDFAVDERLFVSVRKVNGASAQLLG
jgi:hypothetical protein